MYESVPPSGFLNNCLVCPHDMIIMMSLYASEELSQTTSTDLFWTSLNSPKSLAQSYNPALLVETEPMEIPSPVPNHPAEWNHPEHRYLLFYKPPLPLSQPITIRYHRTPVPTFSMYVRHQTLNVCCLVIRIVCLFFLFRCTKVLNN